MRKLSLLILCPAVAVLAGCSAESEDVSGFHVSVLDSVQEAVYDDLLGQYKAIVSDGNTSLTLLLGMQSDGLSMDIPVPVTGNYSFSENDGRQQISDGSSWTDGTSEFIISEGSVSAYSMDGKTTLSGSVSDGKGNSLHFMSESLEFTHSSIAVLDFSGCTGSCSGGKCTIELTGESGDVTLVVSSPDAVSGDEIPAGEYRMTDKTLEEVNVSGIEGLDGSVADGVLTVARKSGLFNIAGVLRMGDGQVFRIVYEGYGIPESAGTAGNEMCGQWTMTTEKWCLPDDKTGEWTISDSYDASYSVDIVGFSNESTMVLSGLFDVSFNCIGKVSGRSLIVESNPETNPVAFVNTSKGNYSLFLALFDPDTGYIRMWDEVELALSDDGSSLSVVGQVHDFTDSQTGQTKHANYRYMGLLGLDEEGLRVSMFEQWPFAELPVFVKDGAMSVKASNVFRRSSGEPLSVNSIISRDEVISVTPVL